MSIHPTKRGSKGVRAMDVGVDPIASSEAIRGISTRRTIWLTKEPEWHQSQFSMKG